jgi:hypothetical protein
MVDVDSASDVTLPSPFRRVFDPRGAQSSGLLGQAGPNPDVPVVRVTIKLAANGSVRIVGANGTAAARHGYPPGRVNAIEWGCGCQCYGERS